MTFEEKLERCQELRNAVTTFTAGATTISDEQALTMSSLFPEWKTDTKYLEGQIVSRNDRLYHIEQDVTSLENQPPESKGMLAIYRPIDVEHSGTLEDPIPWIYGMDCYSGKYYTYNNEIYKCNGDMIPCVWAPGSEAVYQWEKIVESEIAEEEEPALTDGTLENPIPFVLSMDCEEGKYYSYNSKVYLCKLTMLACSWAPDTSGLWQWELVE